MPRTLLFSIPADGGESTLLFPDNAPCHEATCFLYNGENLGGRGPNARISEDGKLLYCSCECFNWAMPPDLKPCTESDANRAFAFRYFCPWNQFRSKHFIATLDEQLN